MQQALEALEKLSTGMRPGFAKAVAAPAIEALNAAIASALHPALRDAAQQALSALESCYDVEYHPADGTTPQDAAITALRAALSARQPAPAACPTYETTSGDTVVCKRCGECWPSGAERACVRAHKLLAGIEGKT